MSLREEAYRWNEGRFHVVKRSRVSATACRDKTIRATARSMANVCAADISLMIGSCVLAPRWRSVSNRSGNRRSLTLPALAVFPINFLKQAFFDFASGEGGRD